MDTTCHRRWDRTRLGAMILLSAAILLPASVSAPATARGDPAAPPVATAPDPRLLPAIFGHHRPEVGSARLHYVRGGVGPVLVLLHGWPTTWWEWHRVMPTLARGFDVIAVDMRGLGDSSRPEGGYDDDALADDVAALLRSLGVASYGVAGHDLGGQVAFALARRHPEAVRALAILYVPLPGLAGWDGPQPWHFSFNAVPDVPEALVAGREDVYLRWFWETLSDGGRPFDEADEAEFLRAYRSPGAMRAGFAYYRAFPADAAANRGWAARGGRLAMPVLWLGSEDTSRANRERLGLGTGSLLGRQLAPVAVDLRGGVLPGCGHWLVSDCAEAVAGRLGAFFSPLR